jgi:hypothetical protein
LGDVLARTTDAQAAPALARLREAEQIDVIDEDGEELQ